MVLEIHVRGVQQSLGATVQRFEEPRLCCLDASQLVISILYNNL